VLRIDANERHRDDRGDRPLAEVQAEVMAFLCEEAGFAQVYTVNRAGYPVGRTMGAPVNPDWSVDLVQRRVHRRLSHLAERPQLEILWVGPPAPGSVNDRPHVYDFGLDVPRVVFLRGTAEAMDDGWTLERYRRQTAAQRDRGLTKAPERTDDNVRAELVGVHVVPVQVRAEGFGVGAQSYTWTVDATPSATGGEGGPR
jgi:hypothetical protein